MIVFIILSVLCFAVIFLSNTPLLCFLLLQGNHVIWDFKFCIYTSPRLIYIFDILCTGNDHDEKLESVNVIKIMSLNISA